MISDVQYFMTHLLYFSDTKPYSVKQVLCSKMHLFCLITDNGHPTPICLIHCAALHV